MPTTQEDVVFTRVAKVFRQYLENDGIPCPDKFEHTTRLDSMELDSLSIVELTLDLEEEFDVEFFDADVNDNWVTLGDVVETVRKLC